MAREINQCNKNNTQSGNNTRNESLAELFSPPVRVLPRRLTTIHRPTLSTSFSTAPPGAIQYFSCAPVMPKYSSRAPTPLPSLWAELIGTVDEIYMSAWPGQGAEASRVELSQDGWGRSNKLITILFHLL